MRTLADTALLLHHGRSPAEPLTRAEAERVLNWARDVLIALEKLHRFNDHHGSVSPETVKIGHRGARLLPPNGIEPPPEFRDPERERWVLRDTRTAHTARPRHDVYGAGALLFHLLEGGPPTAGHAAPFTRAVPPAAAYIASRGMAEGDGRYPTARAMRDDVDHLLRLIADRDPADVPPEDLPSFKGGERPRAKKLVPFMVRKEREKRVRPWRRLLAFLLVLVIAGGVIYHQFPGDEPAPDPAPAVTAKGLSGLLAGWRARLDERLRAAGEGMSPADVPLVFVTDLDVRAPRGWPLYPSRRLAGEMRSLLATGASPGELQDRLLTLVGADTLPAVLHVTEGARPGRLRARLYYRTLVFDEQVDRAEN